MKNFLLKLLYLTLGMGVIGLLYAYYVPGIYYTKALPFLYPFFYVITALIYYIVHRVSRGPFPRFINYYMILTVLKLLLLILVIVIYALLNREKAIPFFITFFVFYLVYTVFEVVYFLKDLKGRKQESDSENPE
ncbi:MAG: hypothetical protein K9G58_08375 [Bacteroidales bacterium]|nr:hypothetical protein [Bacteroidales bacterium]MCF8386290.1 hypothetical protein [Bacteroidales bacterium]MCF8398167.1 hypothetical protein [Bacteroidales bacterium]